MFVESVMLSSHLILCYPTLFYFCLQSFPASGSFPMSWLFRWPKYWSFSIISSSKYSGLISFRIDWLDLLAVQRTLKSLLQHHNLKASILEHSGFFMAQLSCPHMTAGKIIALSIKPMSQLFNTLSRFIIVRLTSN